VGPTTPEARAEHTEISTGTEMIVWGGGGTGGTLATGARYDPATGSWSPTTEANAPEGRSDHTAVWTGAEMIVWGGHQSLFPLTSGGRYDPGTDSWTPTSMGASLPSPRIFHTAVWTGTTMIVWGGFAWGDGDGGTDLNTGGRYQPATDTWAPTSTGPGVPTGRLEHSAVWAGTEMIVWGGGPAARLEPEDFQQTGGRYDPVGDSWTPTSTGLHVPPGRVLHHAVWTGAEMIVWGGGPWFTPPASAPTTSERH
jgi:hypothetical protein